MNHRVPKSIRWAVACTVFALCAPGARADQGIAPLLGALDSATSLLNLRLRSETVSQDGFAADAHALTLRSRLGFQTGAAWDTKLLAEATLNWPLDTRYNSTTDHHTAYPVVADPEDYALDRLELTNTSLPGTVLSIGRQRINLDDQRFIGSVGFRQNEQTLDSASIVNESIPGLTLDFTYLDRVNRIFGVESTVGHFTGSSYLARAAYQTPFGTLIGFGYWLAFNQDHPDSTRTLGVRFAGAHKLGAVLLHYSASYAHQDPYADNALHFSADYYSGALSATYAHFTAGAGVEVMGGNGVKGFTTPLATLHKFDGWADEFLTTPANGIEDRYGTLGYALPKVAMLKVLAVSALYHDFRSARLGIHYGAETDLQLLGTWRKLTGIIAFADYTRDRYAADTKKLWVEVDYALNGG